MWFIKRAEDGSTVKVCYSQKEAEAWVAQRKDYGWGPLTISWVEMP